MQLRKKIIHGILGAFPVTQKYMVFPAASIPQIQREISTSHVDSKHKLCGLKKNLFRRMLGDVMWPSKRGTQKKHKSVDAFWGVWETKNIFRNKTQNSDRHKKYFRKTWCLHAWGHSVSKILPLLAEKNCWSFVVEENFGSGGIWPKMQILKSKSFLNKTNKCGGEH